MGRIGFPQVQQAEDVEYDHEQDAEQDRNQHDRGRKSFHVSNATPPIADGVMPHCWPPVLVASQRPAPMIARAWPDT
jgi:hypothetical protein